MRLHIYVQAALVWGSAIAMFAIGFIATIGCGSPAPAATNYKPLAAAVIATEVDSAPSPAPSPSPVGKCDNCNGRGKVGDGTVMVDCPVCGGDGIKSEPVSLVKHTCTTCGENCDCDPCLCDEAKIVNGAYHRRWKGKLFRWEAFNCSLNGECSYRWVEVNEGKPASAPVASGGCASGNCGTVQRYQPRGRTRWFR